MTLKQSNNVEVAASDFDHWNFYKIGISAKFYVEVAASDFDHWNLLRIFVCYSGTSWSGRFWFRSLKLMITSSRIKPILLKWPLLISITETEYGSFLCGSHAGWSGSFWFRSLKQSPRSTVATGIVEVAASNFNFWNSPRILNDGIF